MDSDSADEDMAELEEMLYSRIHHDYGNNEGGNEVAEEHSRPTDVKVEEINEVAPVEGREIARRRQLETAPKEAVTVISASDNDDIECLGSFPGVKDESRSNTCSTNLSSSKIKTTQAGSVKTKAVKNERAPTECDGYEDGEVTSDSEVEIVEPCKTNSTETADRVCDGLEDGEVASESEVEIICETKSSAKSLKDSEADNAAEKTVKLEDSDDESVLSELDSSIKTDIALNVQWSKPWSLDIVEPDDEDELVRTCSCPETVCNWDSDVSLDFSVTDIQENMSDCCWQIPREDRDPDMRLNIDDLVECKVCGLTGHRIYDCPQLLRPSSCHYCGKRKHVALASMSQCPNALCLLCWEKGHVEQRCPRQWIKDNTCDLCNNTGHTGMQCQRWWNGHYDKDTDSSNDALEGGMGKVKEKLYCCNCSGKDHSYDECKLPRPSYDDYRALTGDNSDSEDEVRMIKVELPTKGKDSFLWSLNVCSVDKDRGEGVLDIKEETTRPTYHDFLKEDSEFRRDRKLNGESSCAEERKSGMSLYEEWNDESSHAEQPKRGKKRKKSFKKLLQEVRRMRKRQKKHRKERRMLDVKYGKVGGDGGEFQPRVKKEGKERKPVMEMKTDAQGWPLIKKKEDPEGWVGHSSRRKRGGRRKHKPCYSAGTSKEAEQPIVYSFSKSKKLRGIAKVKGGKRYFHPNPQRIICGEQTLKAKQ